MRRRKDGEDAAQVAEDELNEHSELKHRDQGSQSIARIASLIGTLRGKYEVKTVFMFV